MTRLALLLSLVAVSCGGGGDDEYNPEIDPARFSAQVTNQYFPLVPGTIYEYDVQETGEHITVTVTTDTRVVMGVTCTVVHDVASEGGTTTEDTYDWYAQDDQGNVWYFGEDTTAYDGSMSTKEGSWEAGVDGAKPGRIALANPQVGDSYRQEYLAGEAEDQADVLALDESVTVPYGTFTGCMKTKDYSALEPEIVENKYYCPGVGVALTVTVMGAPETEELTMVTAP